jgi:hypothetical protein
MRIKFIEQQIDCFTFLFPHYWHGEKYNICCDINSNIRYLNRVKNEIEKGGTSKPTREG